MIEESKSISVNNSIDFVSLMKWVTEQDIRNAVDKRTYFAVEDCEYWFIINALQKIEPRLMEPESDSERLREILVEPIQKVIYGYPEIAPKLVIYRSEHEYLSANKNNSGSAGSHSIIEDKISTYNRELFKVLNTLAHEEGHAVIRLDDGNYLEKITLAEEGLDMRQSLFELRKKIVVNLNNLKSIKDNSKIQQIEKEVSYDRNEAYKIIGSIHKIEDAIKKKDNDSTISEYIYDYLEESGAYLFERIVFNEYARTNPAGELLIRYVDMQVKTKSKKHFIGYKFADELVEKFSGDVVSAFKEIAYADDKRIGSYKKRLNELSI